LNERLVNRVQKGNGKHDQAYFTGCCELLTNRKSIDFYLLITGRILPEDLTRIKRIARVHGINVPHFMAKAADYEKKLDDIAKSNFIE